MRHDKVQTDNENYAEKMNKNCETDHEISHERGIGPSVELNGSPSRDPNSDPNVELNGDPNADPGRQTKLQSQAPT